MKNIFFSLILLFCISTYSQTFNNSVAVTGGITPSGFAADFSFNYRLHYNSWVQLRVYGSMEELEVNNDKLPYQNFAGTLSYFINVYRNRRHTFNVAAGLGGLVGKEILNNEERRLSVIEAIDGQSKIIFGVSGDLEADFYITEHFSFIIKTSQYAHINSDFGLLTNYTGAGIRYYFL